MYCEYFGLKEKPFNITPNPRFLFLSKNHKEVFAHLLYGIRNHSGFIEVTGEVGTGKTTVLRTLLAELQDDAYRVAFIFNPCLSSEELLRSINREFGIAESASPLDALNRFLLKENAEGRTVVLVIDEAQNLEPSVLEQIRLISNLETETDKLIQIILVGQPELGQLLERSDLRQLSQRITVRYNLKPMDLEDATTYIAHRIEIAGGKRHIFTTAALRKIYRHTKGVPRLINVISDRAMLVAYTEEAPEITASSVKNAARELKRQSENPLNKGFRKIAAAAAIVAILAVGLVAANQLVSTHEPQPRSESLAREIHDSNTPAPLPLDSALERLLESEKGSWSAAANGITSPESLKRAGEISGFSVTPFSGNLQGLLKLGVDALLELDLPETHETLYLPYTRKIPVASLTDNLPYWGGKAFLLWENFDRIPFLSEPGHTSSEVGKLQKRLKMAGAYDAEPTGIYDTATIEAVKSFQASVGITVDGVVGPQTLILLYKTAKNAATGERS